MSKCLVTGTVDPPTRGHEALIEDALGAFEETAVAILVNPEKETMFSVEERLEMLKSAFGDKIEAFFYDGMAVDAAEKVGAALLVRGIRGAEDLAYEREMAAYNRAHGTETVFFFAEEDLADVNSTAAREAILRGENAEKYLSENVAALVARYGRKKNG